MTICCEPVHLASVAMPPDSHHSPALEEVRTFVRLNYGFTPIVTRLPGERDWNFLLEHADPGTKSVLKVFAAGEDPGFVEAEVALQVRLAAAGLPVPEVIPDGSGARITSWASPDGLTRSARLVSFLPGDVLAGQQFLTREFWRNLGAVIGRLANACPDPAPPATRRRFVWDLSHAREVIREQLPLLGGTDLEPVVRAVLQQTEAIESRLPHRELPQSLIHGDLNDYNLFVSFDGIDSGGGPRLSGIIDFGDMVVSATIHDLAIAIAYAVLDRNDPLEIASEMLGGYSTERQPGAAELEWLWHLVRLRLAHSAVMAARQQAAEPENAYLSISQSAIRRTLPVLLSIPAGFAHAAFCQSVGRGLPESVERARQWIETCSCPADDKVNQPRQRGPLAGMDSSAAARIDWSISSSLLSGDPGEVHGQLDESVRRALGDGAAVGFGGWGEPRLVYQSEQFLQGPAERRRTIHLGLDLFAPAGTGVLAIADGEVHDIANLDLPLDYGGVVLLRHTLPEGFSLFSLYGHLDPESLVGLKPGQPIRRGGMVGRLGDKQVNGGWPPHLHLQVMADDFGLGCDFPGVCAARWQELWLEFCPNPARLVGLEPSRCDGRAAATGSLVQRRRAAIGRSVRLSYREPVQMVRGWKQYLYDESGRRYLDAYNNVPHVGHCHPEVVAAATRQMGVLNSNTRYVSELQSRFAEQLLATFPAPLDTCFLVNSASEANELALRLIRTATGGEDLVVCDHAYHGHTTTLIDISPYKHNGPGGQGPPPWVQTVPLADTFRGRFRKPDPDAGQRYAAEVQVALDRIRDRGGRLAGWIAETCPSVGGQIFPPSDYYSRVYRMIREAGGLCIADEVQTGYGRMGDGMYAFEAWQVVPDLVILGKPIGNGHPLAAVVTTRAIADAFDNGMEYFSTFGGNHVSCAVGLAVLETVQRESLQQHAAEVGAHLDRLLQQALSRHPLVGEIRGRGLFWGIELVRERETLEPAAQEASWLCNELRHRGILIGTDGPLHNVLKIRPPMPFHRADSEQLVEQLAAVMQRFC